VIDASDDDSSGPEIIVIDTSDDDNDHDDNNNISRYGNIGNCTPVASTCNSETFPNSLLQRRLFYDSGDSDDDDNTAYDVQPSCNLSNESFSLFHFHDSDIDDDSVTRSDDDYDDDDEYDNHNEEDSDDSHDDFDDSDDDTDGDDDNDSDYIFSDNDSM